MGYKKDISGKTVITKLDELTLQKIATAGNGIYVRANNTSAGLNQVFEEISKMEKQRYETKMFSDYEDRFQYFLALALFLLVLELLIFERKSRFAGKIKLFEK